MDKIKEDLIRHNAHFLDRTSCSNEFKALKYEDTEKILKGVCEVKLDDEIIKFLHSKCNGSMRVLNKFTDATEKIAKRLKKKELTYDEIKDIISMLEVK